MASLPSLALLSFLLCSTVVAAANPIDKLKLAVEKTTHLHFYMHDTISNPNPTAVRIVKGPSNWPFGFGDTAVFDDMLTEGPSPMSKPVGRAQGLYSVTAQKDLTLLFITNLALTEGVYNGSTLAIPSRDATMSPVRELPVVGGTGLFRMARGFALLRTNSISASTGDTVLELDVYVMHY